METKTTIPQEIQDICKAFAKVAQENGLHKFGGKFQPEYSTWAGEISFSWEQGRHGEDSNRISIYSNITIHTNVHP